MIFKKMHSNFDTKKINSIVPRQQRGKIVVYILQVFECKEHVARLCDNSSCRSPASLLSITGLSGVTYFRAIRGPECLKHYEDVITCSVQGTLEILSDIQS